MSIPVYKSAIWVPCSPSSDLVTIPYILCNNQLDSPCSSPVCDYHFITTCSFLEVSKGASSLSTPYRLSHSRRCLLVQPYPLCLERQTYPRTFVLKDRHSNEAVAKQRLHPELLLHPDRSRRAAKPTGALHLAKDYMDEPPAKEAKIAQLTTNTNFPMETFES